MPTLDLPDLELTVQAIVKCAHCSRMTTLDDATLLNDGGHLAALEVLCTHCNMVLQANRYECDNCDTLMTPVFLFADSDETMRPYTLCDDCAFTCDDCEGRCDETVSVRQWGTGRCRYTERSVCQTCCDDGYRMCDDCRDYVTTDSLSLVANGDSVCQSCMENYAYCEGCEEYFHRDFMNYDERNGRDCCDDCYRPAEEESGSKVHSYSYQPHTKFFTAGGNQEYVPSGLYHGIELEVGWRIGDIDEYAAQVFAGLGEPCYLKEDGSITSGTGMNNGFEIVTHPCKLDWYRHNLKSICDGRIPGLLSHNASNAGLGLHISVNRGALTKHAIARICAFIGADRNESWIVKLARRKSDEWARIVKKDTIEDTLEIIGGYEYLKRSDNRYEAVNLLNSSHIEFRLFRGTLKYSSAMLCLEFVNALCRWSMEPAEVQEYQSAQSLLKFARNKPETYPHLITFMQANI